MKTLVPVVIGLLIAPCALLAQTTYVGAGASLFDPASWDNGLPTLANQGTIDSDSTWPIDNDLDAWDLILTGGILSDQSNGYTINEIYGGTKFEIRRGSWSRNSVVRFHGGAEVSVTGGEATIGGVAAISAATGGGQDGGFTLNIDSGTMTMNNVINFNNQENQSFINVTGGTLSMGHGASDLRVIDEPNTEFHVSGGLLDTYSLRMSAADTNITVTVSGGKLMVGAGGYSPNSENGIADQRHINFSAGSTGTFELDGADQAIFETFYTAGTLLYDGENSAAFGEVFSVDGQTLSARAAGGLFVITEISIDPGSRDVSVTWNSVAGTSYSVEFSDDQKEWSEIDDPTATGPTTTSTQPNVTVPRRFYRVTQLD